MLHVIMVLLFDAIVQGGVRTIDVGQHRIWRARNVRRRDKCRRGQGLVLGFFR
jgi:hypothetical protein